PLPDAVLAAVGAGGEGGEEQPADAPSGVHVETVEQPAATFAERLRTLVPDGRALRAGVAAVAAALIVGGVVVARRGGDEPLTGASASASTTTSTSTTTTTEPEPVVTTVPPPTTTTAPPDFAASNTDGLKLVYLNHVGVTIVDLDANTIRDVEVQFDRSHNTGDADVFDPGVYGRPDELFVSGGHAFFAADGKVWSASLAATREPVELGPALAMVASTRAGHVSLLVRQENDLVLRDVDARGRASATSKPVPPDWRPLHTTGGLVVLSQLERQQVWNPQTGETVWRSDGPASVIGVTDSSIVWQGPCTLPLCAVHATDRASGADRTVLLAEGQGPQEGSRISLDPTGRRIATTGSGPRRGLDTSVLVHDLATGKTTSASLPFAAHVVWSLDGRWLAAAQIDGDVSNRVAHLWRVEEGALRSVLVSLPRSAIGRALVVAR
ncbi:MAG TPA: hypothetical protein VF230_04280, partial [Acidimicrobiales bacterium]